MRWDTAAVTSMFSALVLTVLLVSKSDASTNPSTPPTGFEGVVRSDDSPSVPLRDAVVHFRPLRADDPYGAKGHVSTDDFGAFHVLSIPPGLYALEVVAKGYATRVDASAPVVEDAVTPMDIRLLPSHTKRGPDMGLLVPLLGGLVLLVVMWRGNQRLRRMGSSRLSARERRARSFPPNHDGGDSDP